MKILAIDTSTPLFCLAIYDDGKVYEYQMQLGRQLSRLLAPAIQRVLIALDWRIDEIDYFGCGLGPGSFTGVRVGLATIKGLAWAAKKPVVGIASLDILARNIFEPKVNIVSAMDARRNMVYCSFYRHTAGLYKRVSPYLLLPEEDFCRKLKPGSIVLGDALALYKERIHKKSSSIMLMDKDYWQLKPRHLLSVVFQRIKEKKIDNAFSINPIYLYPADCQVRK